jgi:hypothetical protein
VALDASLSGSVAVGNPDISLALRVKAPPADACPRYSMIAPNMALQRTRRPRIRSGRSLRSLGSPLNAQPLDATR